MPRPAEIWITGVGAHTAAGAGTASLGAGLRLNTSFAAPSTALGAHWVARAPDANVGRIGRRLDRSSQFFLSAAREAWRAAGLATAPVDPDRVGVIDGSSLGPTSDLLLAARQRTIGDDDVRLHPSMLCRLMSGAGGAVFAQEIGARGSVFALAAGSASGTVAIIEGWSRLRCGLADVMVVGGADAPLDPDVIGVFAVAGILAPVRGALPCRPFDVARCGTVLGEGAGVVVLETATHARRRNAAPIAVLLGAGASGEDASLAAPDPDGGGVRRAVRAAMREVGHRRVGWIKAHGTGTRVNDAAECRGLDGLFEDAPMTSLKPLIGHCLGASGALESVAAVLALADGTIPATLGTEHVDPRLGTRRIALEPEPMRRDTALLLSQSLGGRCAALAIARAA